MNKTFEPIIGMEVHVELATQSKMFCSCPADHFAKVQNSQVCPVCLGLPGALPVPNKKAIEDAQLIGLTLDCELSNFSKFDRKNYFYPDLPKGYQISQYDLPFAQNGKVTSDSGKVIRIRRVHLEEDTARNVHTDGGTLVDFNRSGVPLVEIVTEPDLCSAEETVAFLKQLVHIIERLNVSSCDMEKGTLRLEANISVRVKGTKELPNYKVEIKNVNSFRFTAQAINFEIERQSELLVSGQIPHQETRGFDENKGETVSQRGKEEAQDYRYFPEPDIPPLKFTDAYKEGIKNKIPELPDQTKQRLLNLGVSDYYAQTIVNNKMLLYKFDQIHEVSRQESLSAQDIANFLVNKRVDLNLSIDQIIKMLKNKPTSLGDAELEKAINEVAAQNPQAVKDYQSGKIQVLGFLIGSIVKKLPTGVDASVVKSALEKKLSQNA